MSFTIGCKVAVLDEVISGVVVKIVGSQIYVKSTDGMEYIYLSTDLVIIGQDQSEIQKNVKVSGNFIKDKINPTPKRNVFKKTKNEVMMEVDLHTEKLVKSTKGMDNFDILNLQLETARHKLEYCVRKKISKLVFIHGVGEGVLKSELHYLLRRYPVKFYDASYKEYGLGATEVYVYQNS